VEAKAKSASSQGEVSGASLEGQQGSCPKWGDRFAIRGAADRNLWPRHLRSFVRWLLTFKDGAVAVMAAGACGSGTAQGWAYRLFSFFFSIFRIQIGLVRRRKGLGSRQVVSGGRSAGNGPPCIFQSGTVVVRS